MDLNIVIPVYNEGANIAATIGKISESLEDTARSTRITIVYDFDEDNTLPAIENIRASTPVPIYLQKNTGRGVCRAIKEGILASETTFVLVTMADMSDDYEKLPRMLAKAGEGWDVVCGSRYVTGGHQFGGPLLKKTLSRLAGLSLHLIMRIPTHDITNSYKLYRRSIFETITIESAGGFEIGIEIVVKAFAHGMRITEIPCSWWDRTQGKSRFRIFKWLPLYLKWYLYAFRATRA
jgi:glycosyltransferase involved in cell wall biosynthesis